MRFFRTERCQNALLSGFLGHGLVHVSYHRASLAPGFKCEHPPTRCTSTMHARVFYGKLKGILLRRACTCSLVVLIRDCRQTTLPTAGHKSVLVPSQAIGRIIRILFSDVGGHGSEQHVVASRRQGSTITLIIHRRDLSDMTQLSARLLSGCVSVWCSVACSFYSCSSGISSGLTRQ